MAVLADYKIRVIARACVTRYERGEDNIVDIVESYNMGEENEVLVYAYIFVIRPDIEQKEEQLTNAE
ncbi:hypothetical protein [Heyndrickxia oleronia]|uniref:hypothetical protein n=1 Tax=Heyndrickxia oleronia TaxID=38875 RepID=UPI003F863AE2